MGEDKQKTTNISLRIPEEYRKRLQLQADKKGVSFNAHVLRILEIHMMASGFGPTSITSTSGRLFQIRCEPYLDNVDETTWAFFVDEPKFEKERAYYLIGIGRTILRDWQVKDKAQVSKEVGLALLNFYNRQGLEIDKLVWNQYPGPDNDGRRVLQVAEVPETLEQFLDLLMANNWTDTFLQQSDKSQDVRRGRPESALYR
ncbi:MAG TPA: toxin-antitoxin system HicB family antitoxin [Candidatus Obscuribacterales bacterium]